MQQNSHGSVVLALQRMHAGRGAPGSPDRPPARVREPRHPSSAPGAPAERQADRAVREEPGDPCTCWIVPSHVECDHLPALEAVDAVSERPPGAEEREHGGADAVLDTERSGFAVHAVLLSLAAARARGTPSPRLPASAVQHALLGGDLAVPGARRAAGIRAARHRGGNRVAPPRGDAGRHRGGHHVAGERSSPFPPFPRARSARFWTTCWRWSRTAAPRWRAFSAAPTPRRPSCAPSRPGSTAAAPSSARSPTRCAPSPRRTAASPSSAPTTRASAKPSPFPAGGRSL